ncbi:MAG: hypothetical protein ACTHPD_14990 [Rhizomicrobium sp.]
MAKATTFLTGIFGLCVSCAAFAQEPPCPNDGYIASQMVPNKEVAGAIYRTVGRNLVPSNFKKFPIVVVEDRGDYWEVSQKNNDPRPKARSNEVVVTTGGGQLYMNINKCTGAISHAALAR